MIAPALAQTTGTGSAPKTGTGSSTPSAPAAPSATQPGAPTQGSTPAAGTGAGATGKAKSGTDMGQSATTGAGGRRHVVEADDGHERRRWRPSR